MFRHAMLFIHLIAVKGGGVGVAYLSKESGLSRYKCVKVLNELASCGAVCNHNGRWALTLFGACLNVADHASAEGHGVSHTENMDYMPAYQKVMF